MRAHGRRLSRPIRIGPCPGMRWLEKLQVFSLASPAFRDDPAKDQFQKSGSPAACRRPSSGTTKSRQTTTYM